MKSLLTLGAVAFFLFGCATPSGSARAVVGRWQEVGSPAVTTFYADGRVEINAGQIRVLGRYTFTEASRLRIDVDRQDGTALQTSYSVALSGDKMRLEDQKGTANEYVRVR